MEQTQSGRFVRGLDIIQVDSLVRSLIEYLHGIEDYCGEINFSVERAEATLRRLLSQLDAEPLEVCQHPKFD
jgi:hypothetical protein